MHAISLLHHGQQVYEGSAELRCDETEDDPHAWEVSFRISSAEMAPWAQLDGHADTIQVEFVAHRTASAIVEGFLAGPAGARVLLRGSGLCPIESHGRPPILPEP